VAVTEEWGHRAVRTEVVFPAVGADVRFRAVAMVVVDEDGYRVGLEEDRPKAITVDDVCWVAVMRAEDM
jgi:hypothetical protein